MCKYMLKYYMNVSMHLKHLEDNFLGKIFGQISYNVRP